MLSSAFLWRYEPVRRTGKSDDWLATQFSQTAETERKLDATHLVLSTRPILAVERLTVSHTHSILLHFASELKWSRKMRLLSVFYFSFDISIACWLLSRPNWRIVNKLTTAYIVTYCTEASNQKSKYAYSVPENILLQKSTGVICVVTWLDWYPATFVNDNQSYCTFSRSCFEKKR